MVFLLLLSIMSKFTEEIYNRRNLQHNRHKRKIYNRKKPEVTVNRWRSAIIIHNIIHGIFIIIFTNISKREPSRHSVLKPPPLGCLRIIQESPNPAVIPRDYLSIVYILAYSGYSQYICDLRPVF